MKQYFSYTICKLWKGDGLCAFICLTKQFQQYLLWKLFIGRTDNNLLTYIMTTHTLDATWHQWIQSLARFTFSIEYQKGHDNVAMDALSWVTLKLDVETVKSILDGVIMGATDRADAHHVVVTKGDEEIHKPVQKTMTLTWATCVDLHWLTGWPPNRRIQCSRPWLSGSLARKYRI